MEESFINFNLNINDNEEKNEINENKHKNLNRIYLDKNDEDDEEEIKQNSNINNIIIENNSKKYYNKYVDLFVRVLNFIESYSREIYDILELYNLILIYNKDIFKEIKNSIKNGDILMNNEKNQEFSNALKCCFYFIIESLLLNLRKAIFINIDLKPYNVYKKLIHILPNILKLEIKFRLYSKEIFTLELIYKIIFYYGRHDNQKINLLEINELISLIIKELDFIKNNQYDDLINNIEEIIKLLKKLYGDTLECGELINDFILNKYKIIKIDFFREKLINILIKEKKNNNIYSLIDIIIGNSNKFETKKIMDDEIGKKYLLFEGYKLTFVENNKDLILFYFENIIENYFKSIIKNEDKLKYDKLLGQISLKYLNYTINNINQNNLKEKKNISRKLYLIAYIKRYLSYYVDLLFSENIQNLSERNDINNKLFSKKITIIKEIKLFILKIITKKFNNNLGKVIELKNDNISQYLDYENYFNNIINNKESFLLYYYSYPYLEKDNNNMINFLFKNENNNNNKTFTSKEYKIYLDLINSEEEIQNEKISELYSFIEHYNKYDILYTYISYIIYKSLIINNVDKYLNNINNIYKFFKNKDLPDLKISFNYFLDSLKGEKHKKILTEIKCENENNKSEKYIKFEIILYAFRFFFNILTSNKKNNFYYLLVNKFKQTINSNFIPGKIINSQIEISYEKIKVNLFKNPKSIEYICSCGNNYSFSNPSQKVKCNQCQEKKIKKYSLFGKDFYGRIFLNDNERKSFYSKYKNEEANLLLEELDKKIKEQIKSEKGLKKESSIIFLQKKMDDTRYITFRLLNFILYGFIFYSYIEGIITEEEKENCLVEGMTCYEIIEKDWEILDKELKMKEIPSIHIFLDSIFHKIIKTIKAQNSFNNENDLDRFEKSIDKIIINEVNNKEKLIENYLNERGKFNIINNKPNEELAVIMEEETYNNNIDFRKSLENNYPELDYFLFSKLPSFDNFKNEFYYFEKNKEKYPIINYILDNNSNIKYLKYIPKINELCNYMIDYCSYKFTRDNAKRILINEEIKDKEKLINEFMDIYDELRPFVSNYESHSFKKGKENNFNSLKEEKNKYIANFCVDIGELDYGMVLASIYKILIYWQNSFINQILYSNKAAQEKYKEIFENEIMIQECNENDIVLLPSNNDLMNNYILKNTLKKKYGIIDYNFKLIEEELASDILPNIKKFVSNKDKCLKYVIYQYEGFRGNKNNIITMFNEKYERKELKEEENSLIIEYLKKCEKEKETKKILEFWFSLQILIDIILENNYNKEILISDIINENNKYKNFTILNELFGEKNMIEHKYKDAKLFKVNSIMSIFYHFEFICWDKIKENLADFYLKDIDQNIKKKIDEFFDSKNINIINKINLSIAIRRFVSRYLSGKREENEIKENNNLKFYLVKAELWDEKNITENPEFDKELSLLFDVDKNPSLISVGKAVKVYEYLGGEAQLYLKAEKEKKSNKFLNFLSKIPNFFITKKNNPIEKDDENKEDEKDPNDISRSSSNSSCLSKENKSGRSSIISDEKDNSRESNGSNNSNNINKENSFNNSKDEDNEIDY